MCNVFSFIDSFNKIHILKSLTFFFINGVVGMFYLILLYILSASDAEVGNIK